MADFAKCLEVVLAEEGGYVNDPRDPGGATSRGITQRVYDAWRKNSGLPVLWVKKITMPEVQAIYRAQYWDKMMGDELPDGVALLVFDEGVNSGIARSVKDLQLEVGVHADGVLGQLTLAALREVEDLEGLIRRLAARRLGFLRRLATWKFFAKGWTARVARVEGIALQWTSEAEAGK